MRQISPFLFRTGIEIGQRLEQLAETVLLDEWLHVVGEERHCIVMAVATGRG